MPLNYHNHGFRLQYPENWQLDEDTSDAGWTITLQSPDTTFLLISGRGEEAPEHVLDTVHKALKADYPELEVHETLDSMAGQPVAGIDMQFISLDLTITCGARSFVSEFGTLLIMWQAADLDWERTEFVVKAICSSLELDEL